MQFRLCLLMVVAGGACHPVTRDHLLIETELGDMVVEIESGKAPLTAAHFLSLVEEGVYNGSCFYRVVRLDNQPLNQVKIEVIQGGVLEDSLVERYPVIPHEPTSVTGISHTDGVISMARNQPGTASTEFFICVGDQPSLDFGGKRNPDGQGFAAFGRVIRGMEVVRTIQHQSDSSQMLRQPVRILEIRRLD